MIFKDIFGRVLKPGDTVVYAVTTAGEADGGLREAATLRRAVVAELRDTREGPVVWLEHPGKGRQAAKSPGSVALVEQLGE